MRLICPNCGAQYEVPADVIPEGGRDVQCSNCAHTWFQAHPDNDPDLAEELNQPMPDRAWDEAADEDGEGAEDAFPDTPPDPAPRPVAADHPSSGADRAADDEAPEPTPAAVRARSIDPEVAEMLREERELERRRRAMDSQSLESQPDLGLQEPDEFERTRREREARERMARMRGADAGQDETAVPPQQQQRTGRAAAMAAAAAAGSRRELLPDVEEINQTLRAGTEKRAVDEAERYEAPDKRRAGGSGFSRGFFLMVLLFALAVGLYAFSSRIIAAVPQTGPALDAYVAQVDGLRGWLEVQVARLTTTLDGMSSESVPPEADGGT